jgi:flagellar basal-body rod protein FlgB
MQITTPMSEALNRYLDLSSLELKLTAQNMANVDTPGYRTVGFDFAAEMSRSLAGLNSAEGGATGNASPSSAQTGPVDGLLERPDGNNVSMDREGMKMAEAQLQFRTGVELLKHEFTRELDAIHEDQK